MAEFICLHAAYGCFYTTTVVPIETFGPQSLKLLFGPLGKHLLFFGQEGNFVINGSFHVVFYNDINKLSLILVDAES